MRKDTGKRRYTRKNNAYKLEGNEDKKIAVGAIIFLLNEDEQC